MADVVLQVDPRTVTGKKVRALRRQGIIPAHLYGKETESLAVQAKTQQISNLLRTASRNAVIDLQINGESAPRAVVLRGVQRNPVTGELVHIDFFQISLTEKLRFEVALIITGEAPAATVYGGVLLQNMDRLPVEALPADVPESIEVDVSGLEEIDSSIFVRDLPIPANVDVLAEPDQVVAKVAAPKLVVEEEEEEAIEGEELEEGEEAAEGEEAEDGEAGEGEESSEKT